MLYAIYSLVLISIILTLFALHQIIFSTQIKIDERLSDVKDKNISYREPKSTNLILNQYIKPNLDKFKQGLSNLLPKNLSEHINQTILTAGSPYNLNLNTFVFIQFLLLIIFLTTTYTIIQVVPVKNSEVILISVSLIAVVLPFLIINDKAVKRKAKISQSLPEVLDLLYISVEAGLAFDMALKRTVEKMDGPLAFEFKVALDEIARGKVRSEALRGVVRRAGVGELATFITAVIQSEQLGSNIAKTLRVQSHALRQERRQRAEEKAMKIPIKMLFPLIFFMFPALFIIILGPALISILEMF